MPCATSVRAMARPVRPAPKITTSSIGPASCDTMALHARTASGEPITIARSPGMIVSSPLATSSVSARMMLATFESAGMSASRRGRPIVSPAGRSSGTSNSTIST